MLDTIIPKYRYNTTDYPNLEERAEGMVIPRIYGSVTNITPTVINEGSSKHKLCKNTLTSIDEIRADKEVLTSGTDYTVDLANGEFTFITNSPLLTAGSTYYMIWYADYAISSANYIWVVGRTPSVYANGTCYYIDGSDVWSDQSTDAHFKLYGREAPDGSEELLVDNSGLGGSVKNNMLRYDAAKTKIAQSFQIPGSGNYYITRIEWVTRQLGSPSGDVWIEIHSDQAGTQVGGDATKVDVSTIHSGGSSWTAPMLWDVVTAENVEVDATGEFSRVHNILDDVLLNVIGVDSGDLNAAAFTALGTEKTEDLKIYLGDEITFGDFVEKLEAGQLFKFLPNLDGEYTVTFYASGEPAGTPHLKDEDFISFQSWRELDSVRQKIKIKYDENPTDKVYKVEESESTIAEYLYKNSETLEIPTYLGSSANASTAAASYISLYEYPPRWIQFEVAGYGFDMLPTEKVKITRSRADNTSGEFDAVLFRIMSIEKNISKNTTMIKAILDSQTY